MNAVYAIGDIHGQADALDQALDRIERDGGPDAPVVFIGDYVDRGPDSNGVLQRLIDGTAQRRNWTCLKGNHDRLMAWYLDDPAYHDPYLLAGYHWLHDAIGGRQTLASYGLHLPERIRMKDAATEGRMAVPPSHLAFLRQLPLTHSLPGYVFVHAGIRPGISVQAQDPEDLLWIRQGFLDNIQDHGALVVHGHSAVPQVTLYPNRLNLDGGAGYGRPLTPVVIEGTEIFALKATGRHRLTPQPISG